MPETDLHKAARDGDKDEIDALIQQGLNVNEKGAQGPPQPDQNRSHLP